MKFSRIMIAVLMVVIPLTSCKKKEQPYFNESTRKGTAEAPVKEVPKDILATQQAFINVAKQVNPTVVNISTVSKKKLVQPFFELSPFFEDFFGERGSRPRYQRETSLGSGLIISKDGFILTNDHVVKDAESIQIKLSNDKVYSGRVVGEDPKTDLAVVKISAKGDLPTAVLGDSDKLQVGQWAIAIGNPFGLDRTVTVGVISATGRSDMGIETYEDFIQTDASVNPGNSGGPLLNVYGEVVGINTAIVAAGQGIGFAIPINMAKQIVGQLIDKGKVARGWLGVSIQPVTDEIAQSFGLKDTRGALVSDVMSGSPAEKAGLKQGDIITRFAGKDIKDARQLQMAVADIPAGKQVEVEIFRDRKPLKLSLTLSSSENPAAMKPKSTQPQMGWFGLIVEELPKSMRARGLSGVIATRLDPDGVAAEAGMQPGDIIIAANQKKITNLADYAKVMKEAEQYGSVALLVKRGGSSIYFALRNR